jgi:hypothetical protein
MEEGEVLTLDIVREVALRRARSARYQFDLDLRWAWDILAEAQGKGVNIEEGPWSDYRKELRDLQHTKPGD